MIVTELLVGNMENDMLTGGAALALLFLGLYVGKLFRFVLSAESVTSHCKEIRLIRILLFAASIVCMGDAVLPSAVGLGVRLTVFTVLSGIVLIVCMLAIIVTQRSKWQYAAIGCFLLSAACIGYRFNDKMASSITFDVVVGRTEVELKGDYCLTVPFHTIKGIELEDKFPPVAYRNKGLSMNHKHVGYFKLKNGENAFLFLSDESTPFIHIIRNGDIPVFIRLATPEETIVLYRQLLQKVTVTN